MILRLLALTVLIACAACADDDPAAPGGGGGGDEPATVRLDTYAGFRADLLAAAELGDPAARGAALTAVWDTLGAAGLIPFVSRDSVMFLWRGDATMFTVAGDFNGWSPAASPGTRLGGSDVWIREEVFPLDARLDYKFVLNGAQWILDPDNPRRQRSGFGDNSELRMPRYAPSPWVERDPAVPRGALANGTLASAHLGYAVDYVVYTPAGYDQLADLPVMYVTDGHEYADPRMGSMVEVLDNLIHHGGLRPVMAVFVDPRAGGTNRRAEQYVLNPDFAAFVADELVPAVDAAYRTSADRADRGILGTSLGGLNAAYFGVQATDTFRLIACQSPAFQAGGGGILDLYRDAPRLDLDIFLTWGTIHDTAAAGEEAAQLLDARGYAYELIVVNEGHSWGNWRALLDDILLHYWSVS